MVRSVCEEGRCFALGFSTYDGTVTALADGSKENTKTYNLRPGLEGSSELLCHRACEALKSKAFILPLATEGMNAQLCEALSARNLHRYVGIHYRPDTEMRSHYNEASLVGQYDALVFVDRTSALRILKPEELQNAAGLQSPKQASASNKYGVRRLMQEYIRLRKHPISHIRVAAEDENLYRCHFLLTFDSGQYAGGEYHGLLDLPKGMFLLARRGEKSTLCI